ncbi:MAG: ABC transporter permease [Candidatus Micrarchaeia archaeon]
MLVDLNKVYAVWLREIKRYLNSKPRILGSLGMPFLILIALGLGLSSLVGGTSYKLFLLPGIIGMTLLFSSMFSGVSIIWDREFGFLKEILVSPTSRLTIVLGRILGGATTSLLQAIIMLVLATLVLDVPFPAIDTFASILAVMLVFASSFVAVGISIASILNDVEAFQFIINLVIMPLFFLSNAIFPVESAPKWLQAVTTLNPVTYGIDALRTLITGSGHLSLETSIGISIAFLVASGALAVYSFEKTSI